MPRPRKDGAPAVERNARKLTELYVRKPKVGNTWDLHQRGLCLKAQASGHRSWYCVYRRHGRPRWYHIADAAAVGLADARTIAAEVMLAAARGGDPAAERKAAQGAGTFSELCDRYLNEFAKRRNKSWPQARKLVERFFLPRWGKLRPVAITRADVRSVIAGISAPIVANQALAACSAIFSWAVKQEIIAVNPCSKVDRHETRDRERVLSDDEIRLFWPELTPALKMILLTGQRGGGDVKKMRFENIVDGGWWQMPWNETKNGEPHRVWLPEAARALLLGDTNVSPEGLVFPRRLNLDAEMRAICSRLNAPRATPHDLRRTFSSKVAELFSVVDMHRLLNHREGGLTTVYDRSNYGPKNQQIMEAVAARIVGIAEGRPQAGNVVNLVKAG